MKAVFIQCQQCNTNVMFTAQCSRRKVIFDEILFGLTTTVNRTMPCPLAIRTLCLA